MKQGQEKPTRPSSGLDWDSEIDARFARLKKSWAQNRKIVVDAALLDRAFETAKARHGGDLRESGEPFIVHPLAVAEILAKLRCEGSLLIAALLHDVIEDTGASYDEIRQPFGPTVAELVDAVTALSESELALEGRRCPPGENPKATLDRLTAYKLVAAKHQQDSFLIRMADREHNLATIAAMPQNKQRRKAQDTLAFLVPLAGQMKIRYFHTVLRDYCFKVLFEEEYLQIKALRDGLLRRGGGHFSAFDALLTAAVEKGGEFAFSDFVPLSHQSGIRRALRPVEIQDELGALPAGFPQSAHWMRGAPLNEYVLLYRDDAAQPPYERVVNWFRKHLHAAGCRLAFPGVKDGDGLSCVVSDAAENSYRLRFLHEGNKRAYYTGERAAGNIELSSEYGVDDIAKPQIPVFSKDGKGPFYLPQGATALDFALTKLNRELALSATHCHIRKDNSFAQDSSDFSYPLDTPLEKGDFVRIVADCGEGYQNALHHARGEWFAYVKTSEAVHILIDYFRGCAGNPFQPG